MHHYKSARESWELTCAINFSMKGKMSLFRPNVHLGRRGGRHQTSLFCSGTARSSWGWRQALDSSEGRLLGTDPASPLTVSTTGGSTAYSLSDNGDFESFPQGTRGLFWPLCQIMLILRVFHKVPAVQVVSSPLSSQPLCPPLP